eukprot:TRINITY_DN115218_c0_g1_i1.p2 TRINITY_DN115218_c0_g1~~TRINITY_DN115218_c0_g1_i1.p2  ORF type:complete len:128 (-),score=30.94 TRINITY_DN115218_c0_g1_i1:114-497(-)
MANQVPLRRRSLLPAAALLTAAIVFVANVLGSSTTFVTAPRTASASEAAALAELPATPADGLVKAASALSVSILTMPEVASATWEKKPGALISNYEAGILATLLGGGAIFTVFFYVWRIGTRDLTEE